MLVYTDLVLRKAAVMPSTIDTTSVGGAVTGTAITNSTIGEIFCLMEASETIGVNVIQYSKFFITNASGSDTAYNVKIWTENALDDMTVASAISFVSTEATDNSGKYERIIGFDSAATPQPLVIDKTLNGTSSVITSDIFSFVSRTELRLVADDTITDCDGIITVSGAVVLGFQPAGCTGTTAEVDFGREGSLNGNGTTTSAHDAPSGVVFTRCRTELTAIGAVGGTMTPGDDQGMWGRLKLKGKVAPSAEVLVSHQILATRTG